MAAIRSPPTLEVNGRLIEGTNLASSNPTFGCRLATREVEAQLGGSSSGL
jgi:hypothetical protein